MFLNIGSAVLDSVKKRYILDEIIGQGGFGFVYRAHREEDGKVFAIKTTFPSFSDKGSEEAFKNEICAARKISGNHIIHYEYTHDGEEYVDLPPYIIMEYADGGTLRDVINQRKQNNSLFDNNELYSIYRQLAEGMKKINTFLIHRDIKPENILICDKDLKITDFGLAKVAVEETRTMTFKGGGTPLYMAPEAWDLSKNTIQMDIYSMGIIFYEIAALEYPYSPMPTTQEEAKSLHLYSAIQNISKYNQKISPNMVSVINRMLEKPTKKRFASWDELMNILNQTGIAQHPIDSVVDIAVSSKNNYNLKCRKQESEKKLKEKEKADYCKLVRSQFDNTIIVLLNQFVDKINLKYAGADKVQLRYNGDVSRQQDYISCKLVASESNYVDIKIEVVLKKNHIRNVPVNNFWDENRKTRKEMYIPQYAGKNIMALGEITNHKGLGYNLLLIDNGEIYGDWVIMKNYNNFSFVAQGKERREPFSFSIKELPDEIVKVQCTHLYRAEFEEYKDDEFIQLVNFLAFD